MHKTMLHLTASSCTPLNNYFAIGARGAPGKRACDSPGDKLKIIHASADDKTSEEWLTAFVHRHRRRRRSHNFGEIEILCRIDN